MKLLGSFRQFKHWITLGLSVLLAVIIYLWWLFVSPLGYSAQRVDDLSEQASYRVFAYGTLTNPVIRWLIIHQRVDTQPAQLRDYHQVGLDVHVRKGAVTEGVVFEVDANALRKLDRYERVGERYKRVKMSLTDGSQAWVYQRLEP
ncbi:gamma-glutamylcyclotransferase family protein [Thiomicrospira pelophila]|uniref:gamma-glutamylcyclotransferase family protein n=1 Tax=Thiomicrospira pelophila TaxID=934 RepID=UPI000689E9DA|nr:gamma-glutamylcyclotransferase family protein [Thiomicrospira pelophila]